MKYLVEERDDDDQGISIVVRAPRIKKEAVETRIRTEEARRVPGTQGDTLKVVQNLPGVARSSFGSGDLIIWGSAPRTRPRSTSTGCRSRRCTTSAGSARRSTPTWCGRIDLAPGSYGAEYGRGLGGLVRIDLRPADEERRARVRGGRRAGYVGAGFLGGDAVAAAGRGGANQLPRSALPLVTSRRRG